VLGLPSGDRSDRLSAVPVEAGHAGAARGLLVSLGGDGRCGAACGWRPGNAKPGVGVNLGRLGLLAEDRRQDLARALTSIDEITTRSSRAWGYLPCARRRERDRVQRHRVVRIRATAWSWWRWWCSQRRAYAARRVIVATSTGARRVQLPPVARIVSPTVEGFWCPRGRALHVTRDMLSADEVVTISLCRRAANCGGGSTRGRRAAETRRPTRDTLRAVPRTRVGTGANNVLERARRKMVSVGVRRRTGAEVGDCGGLAWALRAEDDMASGG